MKKEKGFIGLTIMLVLGSVMLYFVISALVYNYKRLSAVNRADTEEGLKFACSKYEISSINHIPQKCFPYLESFNVNIK